MTDNPYQYLAQAVVNHPWAIRPETLQAMLGWLRSAATGDGSPVAAPEALSAAARVDRRGGAVALLPLRGIITQHSDLFSFIFGGTTTVAFAAAFRRALSDESVKAIVIDVDSPGGSVFGIEELAREIYAARGTKPIVAVANSTAASAAYWIASAADEVVVTPSGMVGSIGVIFVHEEFTRMAEALGITVTLISAGEFKTEGHPLEPLTDDAKAYIQSVTDQYYGTFIGSVARGRGVTPAQVREGFGRGRMVTAKEAQKAGMADRVATLDQVVAGLGGAVISAPATRMTDAEQQARLGRLWEIVLASGGIAAASPGRDDFKGTPFGNLPVDEEEDWNPGGAPDSEIISAILGPDGDDWAAYKKANLAYAPGEEWGGDPPTQANAYRLKVARRYPATDPRGTLKVNFNQLANRMAVINGARGGVNVNDKARREAYEHGARYYRKIGREPPEFKEQARTEGPEPLARIEGPEPRAEGRRNSSADQERIQTIHDLSTEIGALCHDDDHD